jgi:hypothetical protein
MFATDDGFLMDDSFLNMKGTTQSANPQGQEIKAKITYKEVEEMFSNDDGFFTDDKDVEEMFATDDGFLTDDSYLNMNGTTQSANPKGQEIKTKITYKEVEEMFSNDDGFFTDDSFSTGNLQSTKWHEPVILLKHTVTEAPLLCRPNVNVHPSQKYLKPRPRPITPNEETKRQKTKAGLKHTNWQKKRDIIYPSGHHSTYRHTCPFQRWLWTGLSSLDNFVPSWAASLYAVWIGSHMVLTDVVF